MDSNLVSNEVVTCFLKSGDKILILRRSRNVSTYKGRWAAVSGYIESTPNSQALIEIEEETQLTPSDVKLIKKGRPLTIMDEELGRYWIIHPYLFEVKTPQEIKIDWEHVEMKWILPSELCNYPTVPGLKSALGKVLWIQGVGDEGEEK